MDVRRGRGALTMPEVLITVLLLGMLVVPIVSLLTQERTTAKRGQLHYVATVAAREEMGDAQFLVAAGVRAETLAHDWAPLTGSAMARVGQRTATDAGIGYDPDQARIATRLEVVAGSGRMRLARLFVRYEAPGSHPGTDAAGNALELAFSCLAPRGQASGP